jgi:predicted secreted protein
MSKCKILFVTTFLFLFILRVEIQSRQNDEMNENILKYVDENLNIYRLPTNGQSYFVRLKRKDILHVKIIGNPTSGYIWYLNNKKELELSPLNLDEKDSTNPTFEKNHYGASAVYDFEFMPLKSIKNTKLQFIYKRSWEPDNNPIIINVNVKVE